MTPSHRRRRRSVSGPAKLRARRTGPFPKSRRPHRRATGRSRNVSDPTVTVFLPAAESATGTAVVVAPGGALRLLGWDNEGVKVAQWLNSKGIAALVLKYRTLQTMPASGRGRGAPPPGPAVLEQAPRKELEIRNGNANPEPDDPGAAGGAAHGNRRCAAGAAPGAAERGGLADRSRARRHHGVFRRRRHRRRDVRWPSDRTRRRISSSRSTGPHCRTSTCPRTRRRSSSQSVHHIST